ncbi:hypothetical protein [Sharpea azabuensis]
MARPDLFYASRMILSTDYATLKNDGEATVQLKLPSEVNIGAGGADAVYSVDVYLGGSSKAGSRYYLTSDKYDFAVASQNFMIACSQSSGGYDSDANALGSVYRLSGNRWRLEIRFASDAYYATRWYGMEQTLTLHIQSFINPFDEKV